MAKSGAYLTKWFEDEGDFIPFHVMSNMNIEIEVMLVCPLQFKVIYENNRKTQRIGLKITTEDD